jgi:hypothetical protein
MLAVLVHRPDEVRTTHERAVTLAEGVVASRVAVPPCCEEDHVLFRRVPCVVLLHASVGE